MRDHGTPITTPAIRIARRRAITCLAALGGILLLWPLAGCHGISGDHDDQRPLSFDTSVTQNGQETDSAADEQESLPAPSDAAVQQQGTGANYCVILEETVEDKNTIDVFQRSYEGNETVLDALSDIEMQSGLSNKTIWVARFPQDGSQTEQILAVDWDKLARGDSDETNYRILPNDRIFVVESKKPGWKRLLDKPGQWIEKVRRSH